MVHSIHQRSLKGPLWLIYWDYCQNPAYHKQPDNPFNTLKIIREAAFTDILRLDIYDVLLESCISQLSIDVGYSKRSLVVLLLYHKQLDDPFKAPEIIRGATWLTYRGYTYRWYTVGILLIIAFHWCKIFKQKLGGPLIIWQAARWTVQCTGDHWKSCLTDVLMLQIYLMYCWNPVSHSFPLM